MDISVVINNYNYARFLDECIRSVISQSKPAHRIIVVDDGSTDESLAVAKRFILDGVVVISQRNRGQAAALNAGFAAAAGDAVLFLDADDYLHTDALHDVSRQWRCHYGRFQFRLNCVDAAGRSLGSMIPPARVSLSTGDVWRDFISSGRHVKAPTSGNVFSMRALRLVMPIPEDGYRICADSYLCWRTLPHGHVGASDVPLASYRIHGENLYAASSRREQRNRLPRECERVDKLMQLLSEMSTEWKAADLITKAMKDPFVATRILLLVRAGRAPYFGRMRLWQIALKAMGALYNEHGLWGALLRFGYFSLLPLGQLRKVELREHGCALPARVGDTWTS